MVQMWMLRAAVAASWRMEVRRTARVDVVVVADMAGDSTGDAAHGVLAAAYGGEVVVELAALAQSKDSRTLVRRR